MEKGMKRFFDVFIAGIFKAETKDKKTDRAEESDIYISSVTTRKGKFKLKLMNKIVASFSSHPKRYMLSVMLLELSALMALMLTR